MLSLLAVTLCLAVQEPTADTPVAPAEQAAPASPDGEGLPGDARVLLSALAGMGTTAAVVAPALMLALPAGLALGVAAGYVASENSLAGGLVLLALNPALMTVMLVGPLLAAPWVGWAVMRWMTDRRADPLATVLPGTVTTLQGAVAGLMFHQGGVLAGLAATVVLFVVVVAVQVMVVGFCSTACGTPVEYKAPRMVDFKLGTDARFQAMALFSLWTLSCLVPTALGAAVGAVAGPAVGGLVTAGRVAHERAQPLENDDVTPPPGDTHD